MPTRETTLPECLTRWLEKWNSQQESTQKPAVQQLAGDGSTRCFYRVTSYVPENQGEQEKSQILLFDPTWTSSKDYPAHQTYLKAQGLPVPQFLKVDPKEGFLLMEDLGDELLQFRIQSEPQNRFSWLQKAVKLLAHFHGKTFPVPSDLPAASRSFDQKKFLEEFSFTESHLIKGLLRLPDFDAPLKGSLAKFCQYLAALRPTVLAHRDYHTRNIILNRGSLFLIDFQDARLGPPHYDLASLLFDPYVSSTDHEKTQLLECYKATLSNYEVAKEIVWDLFASQLRHIAYQRLVKAAGSYASFFTRHGKTSHLPYLLPSLRAAFEIKQEYNDVPDLNISVWINLLEKMNISGPLAGKLNETKNP